MNNGDWTFNNYNYDTWSNDHYDTKEEAIAAGVELANDEGWLRLYIGQVQEIPVDSPMDADDVIERTAESIDDNYGGDWKPGDRFLSGIDDGDSERLQELLDEAFGRWVIKRNIKCPCFSIENIEEIKL